MEEATFHKTQQDMNTLFLGLIIIVDHAVTFGMIVIPLRGNFQDTQFVEGRGTRTKINVWEQHARQFLQWYIQECKRQQIPCDGKAYDVPDAYADFMESKK